MLVTGGAGFVGSHLCDRLIKEGNHVICLDNLFTGSKANISHLLSDSDFEFVEHDVVEPFEAEVDQIYNLACPASPPFYQEDMVATSKICFLGALNMLELAQKVLKLTDSKSRLIYCPLHGDDPTKRRPDISLAKEKLGWQSEIRLDEGLVKTIEYFKSVI